MYSSPWFRCRQKFHLSTLALLGVSLMLGHATARATDLLVRSGDKVAFLGDSITSNGAAPPGGYVRLVESGLAQQGIKIEVIPAGVSGNTSKDMLARLDRDVIAKKPTVMTLSCGVNDVWHGLTGVELEPYKANIRAIVDRAQAAGIRVVILTATMITEDPAAANNQKLAAYNDFLRALAKEKNLPLADLNVDEQAELKRLAAEKPVKGNVLTADGVHPNALGDEMMATGILKTFGLSDEQLLQQHKMWLDLANAAQVKIAVKLTPRQFRALQILAADANQSLDAFLAEKLGPALQSVAGEHPKTP